MPHSAPQPPPPTNPKLANRATNAATLALNAWNGLLRLKEAVLGLERRLDSLPTPENGKDGKDGATGPRGAMGLTGPQGEAGPQGERGTDGRNGVDGQHGEQGIPGLAGAKGDTGPQGATGASGPRGIRGERGEIGPIPDHEWNGTKLRFRKSEKRWGKWVDLKGPAGRSPDRRAPHVMDAARVAAGINEARVLELIAENGGSEVAGTEQKTYHQRFASAGTHPLTVPLTTGKRLRLKYFNFVGSPDNTATENVTLQWARSPTEVIHSQDVSQYGQPHATSLGQNYVTGETNELPEIVLAVGQTVDVNIRYEEVD